MWSGSVSYVLKKASESAAHGGGPNSGEKLGGRWTEAAEGLFAVEAARLARIPRSPQTAAA